MKEQLSTKALKEFIRANGYAWPGGYPCALLMVDGECIDAQSARENFRLILGAMRERRPWWRDPQWTPLAVVVHWEGEPIICAHSSRLIASAYGVPE